MEIKGKFFPVGHGLTYAFKIDSMHVLFDIKNNCDFDELKKFYGNKEINVLVISHFDTDHSDGIQKLYKKGFHIKKIYMPYVDEDEKLILELLFFYRGKSYANSRNALGEHNTEIIEVEESLVFKLDFWEFNIHQHKGNSPIIVADIVANLSSIGINDKDDVQRKLSTHTSAIKTAYKKAIKNLNYTSLFMEHGPVDDEIIKKSDYTGLEFTSNAKKSGTNHRTHSLITGDCNLLNNKADIDTYIDKLGYALVPHHSGLNEWNDFVCKNTGDLIWIVTISQVKSRPYAQVVSDIYSNHEELYICDKKSTFEYTFC